MSDTRTEAAEDSRIETVSVMAKVLVRVPELADYAVRDHVQRERHQEEERPDEEESWTARRPWAELDAEYRGWHPKVRAVIDAVDREQCFRWALNARTVAERWSSAGCTLLGDAVHATLPYMAQGAAMAIEDAAVLARALDLPGPLHERLRRYERHRAPRTARVVRESAEMGELYHIGDAPSMHRAFDERNIARSRNEWLYPYDPLSVEIA